MQRIGFIGIGMMGHGIAKNLVAKGHSLSFLVHRNRSNIQDLLDAGAKELGSPAELARASEIVMLCVTGSSQVQASVYGENGLLGAMQAGQIVIDCSTCEPTASDRVRADFAAIGVAYVDAPLARTPREAEEGRSNIMVGADAATFAAIKPVLERFCEHIFHVGGPGTGHRIKLINNFLALGGAALVCESLAAAAKSGVDLQVFYKLITAGGANSNMFQMIVPKALQGDLTGLMFTLENGKKDIGYYQQMLAAASFSGTMGSALLHTLVEANALGLGEKFIPSLIEAHEKINGIRVVNH